MQLGMVGLGKMGANMTTRLLKGGHAMVVFDRNASEIEKAGCSWSMSAPVAESGG
jgi:6-phosphogluconate dehydrogenase